MANDDICPACGSTLRNVGRERLRAMVLVYEAQLGHSMWQDYCGMVDDNGDEIPRIQSEMVDDLKKGVRDGKWVGWRLHRIEREVLGNVERFSSRRKGQ